MQSCTHRMVQGEGVISKRITATALIALNETRPSVFVKSGGRANALSAGLRTVRKRMCESAKRINVTIQQNLLQQWLINTKQKWKRVHHSVLQNKGKHHLVKTLQ